LLQACFNGKKVAWTEALNELYISGIMDVPIGKNQNLPQISKFVNDMAEEHETADAMVQAALGSKRKAEFGVDDFDHVSEMRDKVWSAVQKFLDFPDVAK